MLLSGCSNLPEKSERLKLEIGQQNYLLEVAKNQEQRTKGLMYRKKLRSNQGMIFYFEKPDYLNFWMKNTYIPLQILFINGCEVVDIQEMAKEKSPANATIIYKSAAPADKAIELNRGSVPYNLVGKKIEGLCK